MLKATIDFKEQIAEARRTQILMGAAQVCFQKGFHQATTKEIAKAAEVAEGTIYNYFDNKRELLMAMMELLGSWSLESIVRKNPPDNPREFLTILLHNLCQLLQERGDFAAPVLAEVFSDAELRDTLYQQLVRPIAAYIEQYLKIHAPSSNLRRRNPIVITYALMGAMLLNFVLKTTNLDSRYHNISTETIIEQIGVLFLDDLRANQELVWFVS